MKFSASTVFLAAIAIGHGAALPVAADHGAAIEARDWDFEPCPSDHPDCGPEHVHRYQPEQGGGGDPGECAHGDPSCHGDSKVRRYQPEKRRGGDPGDDHGPNGAAIEARDWDFEPCPSDHPNCGPEHVRRYQPKQGGGGDSGDDHGPHGIAARDRREESGMAVRSIDDHMVRR
ncbi:hypothetical protein TI39_contig355g00006 [Zymoseptoria brevis]|uniref:Uncharacterized protein n=1 Tax=Zymoseptoria brevis TaxID=1047168 RepID=A0A0F4GQ13_9PEZI|nr:hypothetical protein TI39_contig355g00006 [Zymoseptoria brevis]